MENLSTIWTVCYTRPSRYNWMLQYYLRAEGMALSWVGTGRLIFSLNYSDADFLAVADRFVAAARAMEHDGWWWCEPGHNQQVDPAADPAGDPGRLPHTAAGPAELRRPEARRSRRRRVD